MALHAAALTLQGATSLLEVLERVTIAREAAGSAVLAQDTMQLIQQLTVASVDLLLVLLGDEADGLPLGVVLRQDVTEVGRQLAL